ncbi:MAG: hypothetical protein GTO14_21490 [Anaerolineales bacterium]|nr:hypothetical protein [Anaerolineales bacterium]
MDQAAVLGRTWEITWKHKVLWIFGMLSAGLGSGFRSMSGRIRDIFQYQIQAEEIPQFERFLDSLSPEQAIGISSGIVVLIILLTIVFIILSILGLGGLIVGFDRADQDDRPGFGQLLKESSIHFWRLLGVSLMMLIVTFAASLLLFCGVLSIGFLTFGIGLLCLCPLICLLIPLGVLFGSYISLTQVAVVVDNLGVPDAFRKAWQTLQQNPGPVVAMSLILVVGGLIAGFFLATPMIAIAVPASTGALIEGGRAALSGQILSGLCLLLYLPVLVLANGLLQTFIVGAWTITYKQLSSAPSSQDSAIALTS